MIASLPRRQRGCIRQFLFSNLVAQKCVLYKIAKMLYDNKTTYFSFVKLLLKLWLFFRKLVIV